MYASAYVWAKIINYLEERLSAVTVSAWFDDAEVVELNEEHLILFSASDFRREIIRRRCTDYIQDALKEIFNSDAKLIVFGEDELAAYQSKSKQNTSMDFNPQFSFDNFVVGPSNRFAHGAAIAVSNNPGQVYNPLFIYGPAGVGKTHLLYAIANGIRKQNSNANIVYIKGDQFTNELITALQKGKNVEFRDKYRGADLFLVDDVQFIAGKESTQEEFFHTFNSLYEAKKQIVLTSDRPPHEMQTLEDRLKTRFEWGLIADIQPPDYETRMAIIKNKAYSLGLQLPDDVCSYIAENITTNVRQIEGTVKKIMAYRDLTGSEIDVTSVSRAIKDMYKGKTSAVATPGLIIAEVCSYFGIEENVLRGTLKDKTTAEARQIAMYLIRSMTNGKLSFPDIGKEFGKDHTTVMHACKRVEAKKAQFSKTLDQLQKNINSKL